MTPEQKIEQIRAVMAKPQGLLDTRMEEIRAILDPPVPQWRKRVDALHPKGVSGSNLGAALYHLSHVANPSHYDVAEELANVVVVAEVAAGDGWRADPDYLRGYDTGEFDVMFVVESLVNFYSPAGWKVAGNRAAAWLRHILDGGAE